MTKLPEPFQSSRFSIACFGEVLLRLASAPPALLFQEMRLEASICGAEANVAVALAGLGHRSRMVSVVPDNPIGDVACRIISSFGVDTGSMARGAGRMGLFFLQPGAMSRPSSVTYDRAGSAFAIGDPGSYDWSHLLSGAEWLFVGGITAALGDRALRALREAVATARNAGLRIAFDTNFRPTLWAGRDDEAQRVMRELAGEVDLLFAGRRATAMMAGGDYDLPDPDEGFAAAAKAMFELCPRLQHMAATRRLIVSSDRQDLTGLLADRDGVSRSETRTLEVIVDRVGTGDAFAAGVLHGLITGQARDETVRFATACAEWAHSVPGDFMQASEGDILSLAQGSRDVKR